MYKSQYKKLSHIALELSKIEKLPDNVLLVILAYLGYDINRYTTNDDLGPEFLNWLPNPSEKIIDAIFSVSFWADEMEMSSDAESALRQVLIELSAVSKDYPNLSN